MNPDNRWVKMADAIPWELFERKYSRLFKGKNGRVAKPLRLALGALMIQTKYYQYFIGLPGYQEEPPIDARTLVLFRKRLKMDVIMDANEYMLDATCAPSNIRYPQDFSLLNEAREKLETNIICFCKIYGFSRPRMYRKQVRKNYLALAKAKKRSTKKIRATIRKQLAYIKRDIKYLEGYMEYDYLVQNLGDQVLQSNQRKRKNRNTRITPIELK